MLSLFILHDIDDDAYLGEIRRHLSILERNFGAQIQDRHSVGAGTDVKARMNEMMREAEIVLLLYSDHFGADDECIEYMKTAIELNNRRQNVLVPVILRESNWKWEPFAHLQVLPQNQVPLGSKSWESPNTPYVQITEAVMRFVKAKEKPQPKPEPEPEPYQQAAAPQNQAMVPPKPPPLPVPSSPVPVVQPYVQSELLLGRWVALDMIQNGMSRRSQEPNFMLTHEYTADGKLVVFDGFIPINMTWKRQGNVLSVTVFWVMTSEYQILELNAHSFVASITENGVHTVFQMKRV